MWAKFSILSHFYATAKKTNSKSAKEIAQKYRAVLPEFF